MDKFGFVRIAVCSPEVAVGNPQKNAETIAAMLDLDEIAAANIVVFPELCITGYTCGDLFRQELLLSAVEKTIGRIYNNIQREQLVFVGAPVRLRNQMFNCAIALNSRGVLGIIPKTNIPNYNEFYESRWFRSAEGNRELFVPYGAFGNVSFGTDLLFRCGETVVFAEICEDLWMPIPPSSYAAIAGANVIVNLSASNETVGKNEYRTELIRNQSGRCVAAYAYASAGPSESTTDLVFGGHCLIAENGNILSETKRVGHPKQTVTDISRCTVADIDVRRLQTERRLLTSFGDATRSIQKEYRTIDFLRQYDSERFVRKDLKRHVDGRPFIPRNPVTLDHRCAEVFGIQCAGLYKRLQQIDFGNVYIGVSGGLDSTLALLVTATTYKQAGRDLKRIHGITMPGFGTTNETQTNANALMEVMGISSETIDIRKICEETWMAMGHKPFGIKFPILDMPAALNALTPEERERGDLIFENVQARERTKLLMSKGFVIGTGDMSELALGWCTYNGDHMSMYNVNCSVPKTLVKFLVEYIAGHRSAEIVGDRDQELSRVLRLIAATTISPELLPPDTRGKIEQSTETVLGPYELHDFFLANFIRTGFSPEKILYLANFADFEGTYSPELIKRTLKTFIKRFFSQQFKRSCVPDGPKVGSVSLSPRGDWRMPSDADPTLWLTGK